jgi:hypothetical protein
MFRGHLGVDKIKIPTLELLNENCKRHFRRVPFQMKHRFAEKGLAKRNTIESPGQFSAEPAFHGMGVSQAVKMDISLRHIFGDPGTTLTLSGNGRARAYHVFKCAIERDLKDSVLEGFAQAPRNFEIAELQDQARIRRPP